MGAKKIKEIRDKWHEEATKILKVELAREGITHEELAKRLSAIGVTETMSTIRNKLYRGTFQFSFFLQCALVLNIKNLRLDDLCDRMNQESKK